MTLAPGTHAAGSLRLNCASGRIDITPQRPVQLAGVEGRTETWRAVATPLEANALLLHQGSTRLLIVSADLLYFGPDLVEAVQAVAARFAIPSERVILVASHTHFAPATDRTKPRLGEVDADYMAFARAKLESLVAEVAGAAAVPVRIEHTRQASDLNINRRLRWPLPTWTREGFKLGPNTVMAPAPGAARDAHADVLRLVDDSGAVRCVAWKFACHPVCFPDSLSVCAEYPGHARTRLRAQLGCDVPVLFLQGFTGDVRPRLLGARTWKDRLQALRRGPGFGEVDLPQWTRWSDAVAQLLCDAAGQHSAAAITAPMDVCCTDVPAARLLDAGANPRAVQHSLRIQRLVFGPQLELLFFGAEVCSPYLELFGADERTLCVGHSGHVFGYLPSQLQAAQGGYEGGGYLERFGLAGALQPGFERAVVDAVVQLRLANPHSATTERAAP